MRVLKGKKEVGTNFALFCWSRNMIGWFIKTCLHKAVKILQFFSGGKTQKYLAWLQNILGLSTISHLLAESRI